MKKITLLAAALFMLVGDVQAQNSIHGQAATDYQKIGNTTFGSNGTSYQTIGKPWSSDAGTLPISKGRQMPKLDQRLH